MGEFYHILSIFAIVFQLYIYIIYDRKLKKQQVQINDYDLNEKKQKEIESKQANIEHTIIIGEKNNKCLIIINKGMSTARNFAVLLPDNVNVQIVYSHDIFDLPPDCYVDIPYSFTFDSDFKFLIKVKWDDDYKENNEKEILVTL
ncbi:MAG TPA: hypothetical protein PLK25_06725 [Bacteroidales bacterium]|nr:hypothetical protein [Bacteroidales bacterium]HRC79386.1 hypothetical protein [Bacteroidales bacterium]